MRPARIPVPVCIVVSGARRVLSLGLLGDIELVRDGRNLALPPSKKTRALLAFLAVSGRPHRRERLCEMFYEIPDDPRAALRWSLSRLRGLVDEPGRARIVADRETVAFDGAGMRIDLVELQGRAAKDLAQLPTGELEELASLFRGDFLEGNDLPNQPDFQAWCLAERENARRLRVQLLGLLVERLSDRPEAALVHARALVQADPLSEAALMALLRLLLATGRRGEAEQHFESALRQFKELGAGAAESLAASWRRLQRSAKEESARIAATATVSSASPITGSAGLEAAVSPSDPIAALRPTLAVLPLANISGDPAQEHFSDGMTEEIVTGLSRLRWLSVTARNSSFVYKGRDVGVKQVSRELGARYILEGSVRKDRERVRINCRLTDGETGTQLWAQRYDRALSGIFDVQDEIAEAIVGAIEPAMGRIERQRAKAKKPGNLDAWETYQHGMSHLYQLTKGDLREARAYFARAIAQDPQLGPAYSGTAEAMYYEVVYGFADSIADNRREAIAPATRAVALDAEDAGAHCTLGRIHYMRKEREPALIELRTSLDLNPSSALANYGMGAVLVFSGRSEEGVPYLTAAVRLSPYDPNLGSFLVRLADAMYFAGRYEEAIDWARKALQQPNFQWSRYAVLLAALGQLGRSDEAPPLLEQVKRLQPDFSLEFIRRTHLFNTAEGMEHYLDGLRRAGLSD